jgi:hypothetical protein
MASSELVASGPRILWLGEFSEAVEARLRESPTAVVHGPAGSVQGLDELHDLGYRRTMAGVYVRAAEGASGVYEFRIADEAAAFASEWEARLLGLGTPLATTGGAMMGERPAGALGDAAKAATAAGASGVVGIVKALALGLVVALVVRKVL